LKFALIEREKGSASDRMGQVRPKHGMVATAAAVVHQSEAWFNFTNSFCTKRIFFLLLKFVFGSFGQLAMRAEHFCAFLADKLV